MTKLMPILCVLLLAGILPACGGDKNSNADGTGDVAASAVDTPVMTFSADSAYSYVQRQTLFGPRVPNTRAHRQCGNWLEQELKRHGADVAVQKMKLTTFDGTQLDARNIMGSFNPEADNRLLLLAHWDTRPWADEDPAEGNRAKPNDGANDGASGVGVLLEVARAMAARNPGRGVDILFVDAEDWGSHEHDDSWALGADYFVNNPIRPGYKPREAILLDMVGGKSSQFYREYNSQMQAGALNEAIWSVASQSGYGNFFINRLGGAVTDDHVKFLQAGIPAIDIIAFNPQSGTGFPLSWHTMQDNMENIDPQVLGVVGQTILNYIYR